MDSSTIVKFLDIVSNNNVIRYICLLIVNRILGSIYKFSTIIAKKISKEKITFIHYFYIKKANIVFISRIHDLCEAELSTVEDNNEEYKNTVIDYYQNEEYLAVKYYKNGITVLCFILSFVTLFSIFSIVDIYLISSMFKIISVIVSLLASYYVFSLKIKVLDYERNSTMQVVTD